MRIQKKLSRRVLSLAAALVTGISSVGIGSLSGGVLSASAEEDTSTHEHSYDTGNTNGFGNCPKCNATVYQPAVETTDKYDIDDDGTKETVYEISNAGQLYWFAGLVNGTLDGVEQNTLANAILTTNITVNENLLNSLQYDEEDNVSNGSDFITWTPIADCMEDHITLYSGTFDGNNKTVSGLYFNGNSTRIGLFGSSEADGNIKNVGVVDSYFKGNDFVGGVCGRNDGTITNCYNAGNLTAIESSATIGGICGYNGGTIANCYNTGTVTATGPVASVGGVCGCSIAPISNCYNIGTVTATSSSADISGICGYNFGPVTNCYYLADTEDENGGKTADQFASGEVAYLLNGSKSEGDTVHFYQNLSGENADALPVLDKSHGVVYFYTDCTDKTYYANSETASGEHDFDENGFCTKDSTHYQPATLNETTGNYEISNAGQLYWFADKVNNGEGSLNAVLTADISVNEGDVSGCDGNKAEGWRDWTPIGSVSKIYSGTFDGQNHTVSGLYFNDNWANYVGLFGWSNGTIQNIGIICSYFYGYECVGGVCGITESTIRNCYNTGTVFGSSKTGGMCGYNNYGTIENCYNIGTVFGTGSKVGGVCGYSNGGTFKNCYYLDTCAAEGTTFDNTDGTSKTADQFASGEVAYLLNGSKSEGDTVHFYQNLSGENADALPVLDKSHGVVYFYTDCTDKTYYANSETASGEHDFDENGFCTKDSTHYQPATLNEATGNYEISNAGQLYWFAAFVNTTGSSFDDYPNRNASAVLKKDIVINEGDLSGYDGISANSWRTWTPIGKFPYGYYTGKFDGQGHTISGLYCDANSSTGLFEYNCGIIQNVGIVNSYFKSESSVGGVCGNNENTIKNCYYTGTVSGVDTVGGVCGLNRGTLENCYNTGTVSGTGDNIGGVCGDNYIDADDSSNNGIVKNSYYLDTCAAEGTTFDSIDGTSKTADQFASGEVAYLLNFYQTIGEDEIPTLNEQAKAVVRLTLTYDETFGDDADTKELYYNAADEVTLEESADKAYTYRYFDGETELTEDTYLMIGDAALTVKKEAVKITVPADVDKLELTYKKAMTEVDLNDYVENAADLGELTFAVEADSKLPDGLELSADGTLSGTPAKAADSVKTTVIVTAKNGETAKIELTFQIAKADPTVEVTVDGDSHTEGDLVSELELILSGNSTKGLAKIVGEIKALTAGKNTLTWEFTPEDKNYNVVTGTVIVNAQTTTTTTTTSTTTTTTTTTSETVTTNGTTSATKATVTTNRTTSATKATVTTNGTTSATKA
ncbi:GLUG motif-containing protein, partial [Ruminococcus sp.]|uniref:GLUG motif-containing protein n=1 Tax=Ruminococcus sp. TaxID=41978 RepID=UPI0025FFCF50